MWNLLCMSLESYHYLDWDAYRTTASICYICIALDFLRVFFFFLGAKYQSCFSFELVVGRIHIFNIRRFCRNRINSHCWGTRFWSQCYLTYLERVMIFSQFCIVGWVILNHSNISFHILRSKWVYFENFVYFMMYSVVGW